MLKGKLNNFNLNQTVTSFRSVKIQRNLWIVGQNRNVQMKQYPQNFLSIAKIVGSEPVCARWRHGI